MAFGHHNPSSGKPLWCFLVFICRKHKGLCIHEFRKWSKLSVHYQIIIRRLSARSGFDYKSPELNMDKPVFITTRYGFIINRHNMEGVISTQDSGYHPYYKKMVNQRCDSMSQVWYISYLIILKCSLGYKPGLCVGHYDPSGGKPLGHFKLVICRNMFVKPAWLLTISRQYDEKLSGVC